MMMKENRRRTRAPLRLGEGASHNRLQPHHLEVVLRYRHTLQGFAAFVQHQEVEGPEVAGE